ncbi:long-chain-fatty-acid--[acyl-carrier-protein] ligase AEE15, chloroplastic-like [Eucalyptus grandis]|uniref:long-chain-fatty-acid--[acyl-carrier-protein] ligase AEE15, chloroplastic-like n=1 Tax=Eucalyptus grandis TaxID=71139 RepID=UPI00192E8043|nr:long-chain-fatty-acid--[acyl-carrier-protein] ligase AEE15, chloroplastic-like [Eucalyptus grandis]
MASPSAANIDLPSPILDLNYPITSFSNKDSLPKKWWHSCSGGDKNLSHPEVMSLTSFDNSYLRNLWIQKQLSTGPAARKFIALTFIRISMAFMDFKRIYEGKYLTRDQKEPHILFQCWIVYWQEYSPPLWPLHMLARKIVYSKIHSAIGISKAGISGGGSLPPFIDKFFELRWLLQAIGVTVQNGYGLTECSPVTAARRQSISYKSGLDASGWFNTGDVGWMALTILQGRSRTLEVKMLNLAEIEEAAMRSSLIQQIVVIGQDQRRLGAIIVPNKEEALLVAKRMSIVTDML